MAYWLVAAALRRAHSRIRVHATKLESRSGAERRRETGDFALVFVASSTPRNAIRLPCLHESKIKSERGRKREREGDSEDFEAGELAYAAINTRRICINKYY